MLYFITFLNFLRLRILFSKLLIVYDNLTIVYIDNIGNFNLNENLITKTAIKNNLNRTRKNQSQK